MRLIKREVRERTVRCEQCDRPAKQTYTVEGRLGTRWRVCGLCWREARFSFSLSGDIEESWKRA